MVYYRDDYNGGKDGPTATKFNAALSSLERLHQLLNDCNEYSRMAHSNGYNYEYLKQWRYSVVDVLRELSPKLTDDDRQEIRDKFRKFKIIHSKFGPIIFSKKTEEGPVRQLNTLSFRKQWGLLHSIEVSLRKFADDRRMLIPDSDEHPGDSLI